MRILIVEDEKDLNRIITKKLTLEGYICESCFDGEQALAFLEGELGFDAVILDVMIPKVNGFEVVKRLRLKGNLIPVLMLTARDAISDRVNGLDLGADDYLIKPFAFDELMARIRMILRKSSGVKTNVFTIADLSVDTLSKTVIRGGQKINLSAKEFAVLEVLIRNKGIVLSREHIEERITTFEKESNSNVIDVYIRYLRKKIDDDQAVKLIHTVRGSGYVLREDA
jgi:two-component system copper resistance phosphate regulon response regulator CusR